MSLLNRVATITRKTWTSTNGQRTATESTSTRVCSAQPMSAQRVALHGLDVGQTGWTVYFRGADPQVSALDTIRVDGHVLSVLAPARDEAGRGAWWGVDCREVR
jgi:hypothetical protein